jgi:hypothetical protein
MCIIHLYECIDIYTHIFEYVNYYLYGVMIGTEVLIYIYMFVDIYVCRCECICMCMLICVYNTFI